MPMTIYAPQPEYTEKTRKKKIQGTVLLSLVVGADGLVHDMKIIQGVDPSLDQNSIRALESWRFNPAMKDGAPVAVQVNVEMNFRMY